jgi:LemA protein
MLESAWFWGLCALTVFWALGAYNRLVRLRAQVGLRYAELVTVLSAQTELARQTLSDAAADHSSQRASNDVTHVAACWRRLNASSAQATVALARMQEHCLLPQSVMELNQAWQSFELVWDELKVSPWGLLPEPVRQQWQDNRLLAQPLRRAFNQAIDQYNHAIHQWPASMVARVFQFQSAQGLSELA